jgi:hypothetical protein
MTDILYLDSNTYSNCTTYEQKFSKIADKLLNKTVLVINDSEYRLEEIEFYLHTTDHQDIYTHRDDDQMHPCKWYFHKQSGGSYKGGTYKGLDITFGWNGNHPGNTYGGILIRAINKIPDGKTILGPCKTVDHILERTGCDKINDLVKDLSDTVFKKCKLYLKQKNDLDTKIIYSGPRVGLSFKYPNYAVKNYRFLTNIKTTEKYKSTIIMNLINSGMTHDEIIKKTGIKKYQITAFTSMYKAGQELDSIEGIKPSNSNILKLVGFMNKE